MAIASLRNGAIRKEMLPHCVQPPGAWPPPRAGLCQPGSRPHTKPRPPRTGPPTHSSREPARHASGAEQSRPSPLTPLPAGEGDKSRRNRELALQNQLSARSVLRAQMSGAHRDGRKYAKLSLELARVSKVNPRKGKVKLR